MNILYILNSRNTDGVDKNVDISHKNPNHLISTPCFTGYKAQCGRKLTSLWGKLHNNSIYAETFHCQFPGGTDAYITTTWHWNISFEVSRHILQAALLFMSLLISGFIGPFRSILIFSSHLNLSCPFYIDFSSFLCCMFYQSHSYLYSHLSL